MKVRELNNISRVVTVGSKTYTIKYCNEFDGISFNGTRVSMTKCDFIELIGIENKSLCLEIATEHCNSIRENMKLVTDPIARAMFLHQEINWFTTALKNIGISIEL